jgi:thiol-disulfide isomerase/thioredoxin
MYIYNSQLSRSQFRLGPQALIAHGMGDSQPLAKQIYAGQPGIKSLNDSDFWNIFNDRNKVLVVSFWADSCRPCDEVAKVMASVAESYAKGADARLVNFYQVQWDPKVNPQLYQRFGFKGIPVIYFYYTSTGKPPSHAAPLLEGSLGGDKGQFDPQQYDWRIKSMLRRHGHGHVVRIILIDLANYFKSNDGLRNKFTSRLEAKLNNIAPDWLLQQLLTFRVEYHVNEPTSLEKEGFAKLDFPMYFLGKQHSYEFVRKLMDQHRIPKTIQCPTVSQPADPYELVKACWKQDGQRGCGIPPGQGFRKVGFIKTHKVSTDPIGRRDLAQAFLNVTAHELGHMLNICSHTKQGLMKYPVPLNVDTDFSAGERSLVLGNLVRLRDLR